MDGFEDFEEQQHSAQDNGYAAQEEAFFTDQPAVISDDGAPDFAPQQQQQQPNTQARPLSEDIFSPNSTAATLDAADPRTEWYHKNQKSMSEREVTATAAREQVLKKAKEHFDKFYGARKTSLAQRRESNRDAAAVPGDNTMPVGNTPWERVCSMINFNFDSNSKDPFKELSRYKHTLLTCKKKNVAVKA